MSFSLSLSLTHSIGIFIDRLHNNLHALSFEDKKAAITNFIAQNLIGDRHMDTGRTRHVQERSAAIRLQAQTMATIVTLVVIVVIAAAVVE